YGDWSSDVCSSDLSPSDPDAGQCRRSKVESATRSAAFGVQAPAPASRGHNPHTPNNNVERRPNESLPIRGAGGELTELLPQTISGARWCGQIHRNRFGHALPLIGNRRRKTKGRAPLPGQEGARLGADLVVVAY